MGMEAGDAMVRPWCPSPRHWMTRLPSILHLRFLIFLTTTLSHLSDRGWYTCRSSARKESKHRTSIDDEAERV